MSKLGHHKSYSTHPCHCTNRPSTLIFEPNSLFVSEVRQVQLSTGLRWRKNPRSLSAFCQKPHSQEGEDIERILCILPRLVWPEWGLWQIFSFPLLLPWTIAHPRLRRSKKKRCERGQLSSLTDMNGPSALEQQKWRFQSSVFAVNFVGDLCNGSGPIKSKSTCPVLQIQTRTEVMTNRIESWLGEHLRTMGCSTGKTLFPPASCCILEHSASLCSIPNGPQGIFQMRAFSSLTTEMVHGRRS